MSYYRQGRKSQRVVASRQSSIGTVCKIYAVPTELIYMYYRLPETYVPGNNMCCLWQRVCNLSHNPIKSNIARSIKPHLPDFVIQVGIPDY